VHITDHHHWRAPLEAGVESGFFLIEADMAQLEPSAFWREMGEKRWAHPMDEHGHRNPSRRYRSTSKSCATTSIVHWRDSCAAPAVREKHRPHSVEFAGRTFFRHRIVVGPTHEDFMRAVDEALVLRGAPRHANCQDIGALLRNSRARLQAAAYASAAVLL